MAADVDVEMAANMGINMATNKDVDVADDMDTNNPCFHGPVSSGPYIFGLIIISI
jgi:hypothetical protein